MNKIKHYKIYGFYLSCGGKRNMCVKPNIDKNIWVEFNKRKYDGALDDLTLALSNYMERQL